MNQNRLHNRQRFTVIILDPAILYLKVKIQNDSIKKIYTFFTINNLDEDREIFIIGLNQILFN